jgi:hypothetical protein
MWQVKLRLNSTLGLEIQKNWKMTMEVWIEPLISLDFEPILETSWGDHYLDHYFFFKLKNLVFFSLLWNNGIFKIYCKYIFDIFS